MITIEKCLRHRAIEQSALDLSTNVAFNPRKAYVTSTDGKTFWEFADRLSKRVAEIRKEVSEGTLCFSPMRLVHMRTKRDRIRKVWLSTWHDKVVERWLNECLCRLLHGWFAKGSYAYRTEGVSLNSCVNGIARAMRTGRYFIKRDVTQFFYSIDHGILMDKLATIVDRNDYLYRLIEQRIRFEYVHEGEDVQKASIGVPFGSSMACVLANVYMTDLDKRMMSAGTRYFRYADDFLLVGEDPERTLEAARTLDDGIAELRLDYKPSHSHNLSFQPTPGFETVRAVSHLGLEFINDGRIKLSVAKQRKVMHLYRRALRLNRSAVNKADGLDGRLKEVVRIVNGVTTGRLRRAAIVDYYLQHVDDEVQLRNVDRLLLEAVACAVLRKNKFRKKLFRTVSPRAMRGAGLLSLLHRSRLHRHGHLSVDFLGHNSSALAERHQLMLERRAERVDQARLGRKLRKMNKVDGPSDRSTVQTSKEEPSAHTAGQETAARNG